jgi:hypothetical protein
MRWRVPSPICADDGVPTNGLSGISADVNVAAVLIAPVRAAAWGSPPPANPKIQSLTLLVIYPKTMQTVTSASREGSRAGSAGG